MSVLVHRIPQTGYVSSQRTFQRTSCQSHCSIPCLYMFLLTVHALSVKSWPYEEYVALLTWDTSNTWQNKMAAFIISGSVPYSSQLVYYYVIYLVLSLSILPFEHLPLERAMRKPCLSHPVTIIIRESETLAILAWPVHIGGLLLFWPSSSIGLLFQWNFVDPDIIDTQSASSIWKDWFDEDLYWKMWNIE